MAAVPAVLDLIKTGLVRKLNALPGLKGKLVRGAVAQAQQQPVEGGLARCLLGCGGLEKALVAKVKSQVGLDRLGLLISGGAPLAPETQAFCRAVLAPVAQGYGATECVGCATVQECFSVDGRPVDLGTGHVGAIQPAMELKLLSVPDMGYFVGDKPDPRGEILISGTILCHKGYYKMDEVTAQDFKRHADGKVWFHTGDVGVVLKTGVLKIIDRKKDLIKLSGGEYVSLGKVENALKQVSGIGACVVFARSDKDHCVAIVSQPERGWASVGGKPIDDALIEEVGKSLRNAGLPRFEIPTKLKVDDTIWTPESGLVTASMKISRNALREHYNSPGGVLAQMGYQFPDSQSSGGGAAGKVKSQETCLLGRTQASPAGKVIQEPLKTPPSAPPSALGPQDDAHPLAVPLGPDPLGPDPFELRI